LSQADAWKREKESEKRMRDLKWIRENPEIATANEVLELYDTITEGVSFARLEEICNAERDGRCVVMPRKVGETVWIISDSEVFECVLKDSLHYKAVGYNLEIGRTIDGICNGKQTVFLTRPEAEATLNDPRE
jgi:hypothetical protein